MAEESGLLWTKFDAVDGRLQTVEVVAGMLEDAMEVSYDDADRVRTYIDRAIILVDLLTKNVREARGLIEEAQPELMALEQSRSAAHA